MAARTRDQSLGEGVYYAREDYIGILRRCVIIFVDLAVLILLGSLYSLAYVAIAGDIDGVFLLTYSLMVWLYLTAIKSSRIRTVGYRLAGARIVNLRGDRPSLLRMTIRVALWMIGPFNLLFDVMWAGVDDDRQSLRDRFAGTCVIKNRAEPIGRAPIHLCHYNAMGYTFIYPHVMRPQATGVKVEAV